MKHVFKYLWFIFIGIILFFSAALCWYDLTVYQLAKRLTLDDVSKADPEDRSPSQAIKTYLKAAGELSTYNVSRFIHFRATQVERTKQLQWYIEVVLFVLLTEIHISEEEATAIVASQSYNGEDHGLSSLSKKMFQKPLNQLNLDEAAQAVAILKAPSRYTKNEDVLKTRKNKLLKSVEDNR